MAEQGAEVVAIHVGAIAERAMRGNGGVLPADVPEDAEETLTAETIAACEGYMRARDKKRAKVVAAINARITPFGRVRAAWAAITILPLVVPPMVRPLRGKREKGWRMELLVAPTMKPTPKWRRYMIANFGQKICGIYRETPNPNNPLPCSVEGWWWHAGLFFAGQLGGDVLFNPTTGARLSATETQRWAVWLDAMASGREIGALP